MLYIILKIISCIILSPPLFSSLFIIIPQRYSYIQAAKMIMKDPVDSGDDSEIGDSNSISSCSASSSSIAESESESNDEITVHQLPRKQVVQVDLEAALLFILKPTFNSTCNSFNRSSKR